MIVKTTIAVCLVALYLVSAEDNQTTLDKTVFNNLTDTNWKDYFFDNSTDGSNVVPEGRNRQGKDFFDFIGLSTGPETDPYLARTNSLCLTGDLSECFKSRALSSLDDFFTKEGKFFGEFLAMHGPNMAAEKMRSLGITSTSYNSRRSSRPCSRFLKVPKIIRPIRLILNIKSNLRKKNI